MDKQTINKQECPCPAVCKVVGPILMIVFGVIALVHELTGKEASKQEVCNG